MEPVELLAYVTQALDAVGVEYLVCGSTASIHYGEPRYTHDIDLVVDLRDNQIEALARLFPESDWYFDDQMIRTEIARRGMFNLLHIPSGLKVDCYLVGRDEYARQQWSGRRPQRVGERLTVSMQRPEDVILMKLVYYREGRSDKHLRDIASVLSVQGDALDYRYLDRWAERLGVDETWRELRRAR